MGEDDLLWLEHALGDEDAALVWPAVEDAERTRLIRVFGYPKDNAIPPKLPLRLALPSFRNDLLKALHATYTQHEATRLYKRVLEVCTHGDA